MSLVGKVALVTGGSRGIGRGIAMRLAREGARVAVHYGHDELAAEETVTAIEALGGSAFTVRAQLGVPGDAEALWQAYDAEASVVDIIVNNAGTAVMGPFAALDVETFDQLVAINARAPFFIIQLGLGRLRDDGRIINISSAVTRVSSPDAVAYGMTKSALNTMTLALSTVLAPRGITVNTVAPGLVETSMTEPMLADPATARVLASLSVFGRIGQPADIADVVGFLCSEDSRWITGQCIDVSGGTQL
ncbi:SDR family oxidoreductase [Kribbella sp. NPDC023855]|uniref:SDR family oxidoreductase n=1 Tax=Kribbella sp. NPDC023855 TaxID=3154698 RepID=UPI0033CACB9A